MPLLYHKTVYHVLALPVYYVTTLYTSVVRNNRGRFYGAGRRDTPQARSGALLLRCALPAPYIRDIIYFPLWVRIFFDFNCRERRPRRPANVVLAISPRADDRWSPLHSSSERQLKI